MSKKPKFTRRIILQKSGVLFPIPFLTSLFGEKAKAAGIPQKKNFIAAYFPNGAGTKYNTNRSWTLAGDYRSLQAHKNEIMSIRGATHSMTAKNPFELHIKIRGILNAAHPTKPTESIDQMIAQRFKTPIDSLVLGFRTHDPYHDSMSFNSKGQQIAPIRNPRQLFNHLFTQNRTISTKIRNVNKIVNDFVLDDLKAIRNLASKADKLVLDEYYEQVYEINKNLNSEVIVQTRLRCAHPAASLFANKSPSYLVGNPTSSHIAQFKNHWTAMQTLSVIAVSCGMTNAVSMAYDSGYGSAFGVDHHTGSHGPSHGDVSSIGPAKLTKTDMNVMFAERFAQLIALLKQYKILDETVAMLMSGMGHGGAHASVNLPIIIASQGPGLNLGKEIGAPTKHRPMASLLSEVLRMYGINKVIKGAAQENAYKSGKVVIGANLPHQHGRLGDFDLFK